MAEIEKANGTGLHAVALLCPHERSRVSGGQNSHENYASVMDGACLARPKRSARSQLAPSAGGKQTLQVFGKISALI